MRLEMLLELSNTTDYLNFNWKISLDVSLSSKSQFYVFHYRLLIINLVILFLYVCAHFDFLPDDISLYEYPVILLFLLSKERF